MIERHTSTLDSVMAGFKHQNREALMGTPGVRRHTETDSAMLGEDSGTASQTPNQQPGTERPTTAAMVQRVLEQQRPEMRDSS
jgi:hypothetical protein